MSAVVSAVRQVMVDGGQVPVPPEAVIDTVVPATLIPVTGGYNNKVKSELFDTQRDNILACSAHTSWGHRDFCRAFRGGLVRRGPCRFASRGIRFGWRFN